MPRNEPQYWGEEVVRWRPLPEGKTRRDYSEYAGVPKLVTRLASGQMQFTLAELRAVGVDEYDLRRTRAVTLPDGRRLRPDRRGFVQRAVLALLAGEDGRRVVERFERWYETKCTIKAKITLARRWFMGLFTEQARIRIPPSLASASNRHESHDESMRKIRARAARISAECRAYALEFVELPLAGKMRRQRQHRHKARHQCSGDDRLDQLVRTAKLLPDNLASFRPSSTTVATCKETSKKARLEKNEYAITVDDAQTVLRRARDTLDAATEATPFPELAWALLLVSGRRFSEIMNGRSVFTGVAGRTHACLFDGQLKKGAGAQVEGYTTPLLVPFDVFDVAFATLRRKQSRGRGRPPHECTPEEILKRYHGNYCRYVDKHVAFIDVGHDLRALYASMVYQAFPWTHTLNVVAMRCLGHAGLEESLSYNHMIVRGVKLLEDAPPIVFRGDAIDDADVGRRCDIRGRVVLVEERSRDVEWDGAVAPSVLRGRIASAHKNGMVTLESGVVFENPSARTSGVHRRKKR